MKKVIVFGGSGFLGSHVADKLIENDYDVTIFDKIKSKYLLTSQKMIVGDVLNPEEVNEAIIDKDIVYNFAGLADIEESKKDPIGTVKQNILGNSIISRCPKQNKCWQ